MTLGGRCGWMNHRNLLHTLSSLGIGKPSPTNLMEIRCTMMCDNSFRCKFSFSGVDISITWDAHLVLSQDGMVIIFKTIPSSGDIAWPPTTKLISPNDYQSKPDQHTFGCMVPSQYGMVTLQTKLCDIGHPTAKPDQSRWLPIDQSITDQTTFGCMFNFSGVDIMQHYLRRKRGPIFRWNDDDVWNKSISIGENGHQATNQVNPGNYQSNTDNPFLAKIQIHEGRTNRGC